MNLTEENLSKISGVSPYSVFSHFAKLSSIPHGSGNTEIISNYLAGYAKERNLKYIQDEIGNVIIYKDAAPGYEDESSVIIQGHMDMVAVKDDDCTKNMSKEGLDLYVDGDFLRAKGTSLGGDDGIAIAMALAILEDDKAKHPALEAVFTIDEEVGMEGAAALDGNLIKGRRLLNIDNEEEGHIITGCAGGARADIHIGKKVTDINHKDNIVYITIDGGLGGHSGVEIDKGRCNTNIVAGLALKGLLEKTNANSNSYISLVDMYGGSADNAIPCKTELVLATNLECDICQYAKDIVDELIFEYKINDSGLFCTCRTVKATEYKENVGSDTKMFSFDDTKIISELFSNLPNGIQAMSMDVEGLVETSLNCGVVLTENNSLSIRFALRSSVESAKKELMKKLEKVAGEFGAALEFLGVYPGWQYRVDSPFRDKLINIYEEMFGETPVTEAIHAGLECGFFASKLDNLDCVSIGPDIIDIHTTSEKLSISSVERTYNYVCEILSRKG